MRMVILIHGSFSAGGGAQPPPLAPASSPRIKASPVTSLRRDYFVLPRERSRVQHRPRPQRIIPGVAGAVKLGLELYARPIDGPRGAAVHDRPLHGILGFLEDEGACHVRHHVQSCLHLHRTHFGLDRSLGISEEFSDH
jgi:hypothetical protein